MPKYECDLNLNVYLRGFLNGRLFGIKAFRFYLGKLLQSGIGTDFRNKKFNMIPVRLKFLKRMMSSFQFKFFETFTERRP